MPAEPAAPGPPESLLERTWREHWGRLLALLVARFRRLDLAEDALADAFAEAARRWPDDQPDNPAAWLLTTARRRCLDRLRAEAVHARKAPLLVVEETVTPDDLDDEAHIPDDRLRLIFTCCHPALAPDARAALTLRFVVGLTTADIARLFLVPETTMAARLTRAKKKITAAGIAFAVPGPELLDERTDVVAAVLYLVFTAGYAPGSGPDAVRVELAGEAIRLARTLDELLPGRPVVRALLALMLLQHARRDARADAAGRLVLLPDQDRTRWRLDEIAEGLDLLAAVPPGQGPAEEYRLQALVAAAHSRAATAADTDWDAVAAAYAELELRTGSPVVRLNRAVAVAEVRGPAAALALLEGLDSAMPGNHRLPLVRAELLLRLGRSAEAVVAYDAALARCGNAAERRHITARRAAATDRADGAGRADDPAGGPPGNP